MKIVTLCSEGNFEKYGNDIKQKHDVIVLNCNSSIGEILGKASDADALLTRSSVVIPEELINGFTKLKLIQTEGVGFEKIAIPAANAKGIIVCNAKASNSMSVAEHVIMLMLSVNKKLTDTDYKIRQGKAKELSEEFKKGTLMEFSSKKVGIIGLGAIGKEVVKRLKPFGCELYYYDLFPQTVFATEHGVEYLDIDELCKTCNVITLHAPITESTINILNKNRIAMLPKDCIIINTARGKLLDQQALADAIEIGNIYGAGIDTVESEPISLDNPFLKIKGKNKYHVILTPHNAGLSHQFHQRSYEIFKENLRRLDEGLIPINQVNK